MTATIINNGLKWKKIMIRNPTYTRFNNNKHCIIKMMYFIERIYYVRYCRAAIQSIYD